MTSIRPTLVLAAALLAFLLAPSAEPAAQETPSQGLRIAVVDLNRALNDSQAGQRSKRILLADKSQVENELKTEESELKRIKEELEANIMLKEDARAAREADLKDREQKLRDAVKNAQRELQQKERRYTESIFSELKTVISLISREKKLDLVLEKNVSQAVLFSTFEIEDITDDVISRYDNIQTDK